MATIEITAPDGKTIELTAPDGATQDQIHEMATKAAQHYQQTSSSQPQDNKFSSLDTGLRTMTGSLNPTPPNTIPKGAQVPYTTGTQAGDTVTTKGAEDLAQAGVNPYIAAAAGTAAYIAPDVLMASGGMSPENPATAKLAKGIEAIQPEAGKVGGILQTAYNNPSAVLPNAVQKTGKALAAVRQTASEGMTKELRTALATPEGRFKLAEEAKDSIKSLAKQTVAKLDAYRSSLLEQISNGGPASGVYSDTLQKVESTLAKKAPDLVPAIRANAAAQTLKGGNPPILPLALGSTTGVIASKFGQQYIGAGLGALAQSLQGSAPLATTAAALEALSQARKRRK